MPSFRVEGPTISLEEFDVVGTDGKEAYFIAHAGLAGSPARHDTRHVAVFDMGPPLHGPGQPSKMHATVVGRAELGDSEIQKLKTFIDQHAGEHSSFLQLNKVELLRNAHKIYCVYPHASPLFEEDGRYTRMRFSCGGLALEAYRFARILLMAPESLPQIDMDVIRTAYPTYARLLDSGRITPDSLGLTGDGPWPVLLCGYLFHALDRDPGLIRDCPYIPFVNDRFFGLEDQHVS